MTSQTIQPAKRLKGTIRLPGDKSVSHRSLIFAALAEGESAVENLLLGEDVLSTMRILRQLGVRMSHTPESLKPGDKLTVTGTGAKGFKAPSAILDCGNSGTTMRLMMGVLSACPFEATLTGDDSLNKRPMERVTKPLSEMGANFSTRHEGGKRLITVHGNPKLQNKVFKLPVASAQVKSALLLAGLVSGAEVEVTEPTLSRDHTERMLKSMGANLIQSGTTLTIRPGSKLKPFHAKVPGDFSSAAFFIVAGLLVPDSEIEILNVNTNPTRAALLDVLRGMGGDIEIRNERAESGEEVADLIVRSSPLKGASIHGEIIPKLIDEIPIFAIAAAAAQGKSSVRDASELRVKETDRIAVLAEEIKKLGFDLDTRPDGFDLEGGKPFQAGDFESHGDHRIAMSFAVAALRAQQASNIHNIECVATSFPGFFGILSQITQTQ